MLIALHVNVYNRRWRHIYSGTHGLQPLQFMQQSVKTSFGRSLIPGQSSQ